MQTYDLSLLKRPTHWLVLPFMVFLLLSGCEKPKEAEEIRPVRIITVENKVREEIQVLPGLVAAHRYVNTSFKIPGRLTTRAISVGSTVRAGQLLARLTDEIENNTLVAADAEVAATKAALEQAESVEKRAAVLFKTKAVSQNEFDEASRQLKSALAMVKAAEAKERSAKEQLNYTSLYAPTNGIVTDIFAEVGEVVAAGHPILRLAEITTLDAVFDMPADFLRRGLTPGQTIEVCLDESRGLCAQTTIYEIAPETDPVTRTYLTKGSIDKPLQKMLLGTTVFGRISFSRDQTMEIPAAALTTSDKKAAVWVVTRPDNTVSLRPIEIGNYTTEGVVVLNGLNPGEMVVTAGVQALYQGQKVTTEVTGYEKH